jgi:ectoine hydroxylase-related dioxygenase (phytanoyl-CoA dioxygenase family)
MDYRLTADQIETFQRDGVLYLPGIVSAHEVARLRDACDRVMARPTALGADLTPSGKRGRFFGDFFVWRQDPVFRELAMRSALPAAAQQLMRSVKVNLVWDHVLVKEPHTEVETPWHHDQPYAWCNGTQNCSFWVSLDHVTRDSGAVEYIRGSHRWGRWFEAVSFNPSRNYASGEFEPIPDIESQRAHYDIACYDTEPGDAVVQHLLTVHHAGCNRTPRRRRAIAVRYAGDDATYAVRRRTPPLPAAVDLRHGDPLDSELFPVVIPSAPAP